MSYERNVSMVIFGEVSDVGVIEELAIAMQDFVQPDYDKRTLSFDGAIEHIMTAIEEGQPIHVYRTDTSSHLAHLTTVCRDHGIAYRVFSERSDHSPAYVSVWAPGFDNERGPEIDDDFRPVLTVEEIQALLAEGTSKLQARIDGIKRDMALDIPQNITASREIIDEARSLFNKDGPPSP